MPFEIDNEDNIVQIKVIGAGGGGGNTVDRMVISRVQGVEFIMVNTDRQALLHSGAMQRIQVGDKTTHGKDAGSKPEIGQKSGGESHEMIAAVLRGSNIVFIIADMGSGTSTGATPIVVEITRDTDILIIGIVTRLSSFGGKRHMEQAKDGISALREYIDSLVVIPNEHLKLVSRQRITLLNAFIIADDVLRQDVQSISDPIKLPGLVSPDFADICAVMEDTDYTHMGVGRPSGKEKAQLTASMAILSPLLETSISGAKGVIIDITSSPDIGLDEIETAASMVREQAHEEANIIRGTAFNESIKDEISVTVIVTGSITHDGTSMQPVSLAAVKTSVSTPGSSARLQQGRVEKTTEPDEDDTFTDIMSIFNQ